MAQNIIPTGFGTFGKQPGLMGYNPADMRRTMMSRGLMEMGLSMMGQGPSQYPVGFLSSVGQGAQAGLKAATEAGDDYRQGAFQDLQYSEAAMKLKEKRERDAEIAKILPHLSKEDQEAYKLNPEVFTKFYIEESFKTPEPPKTRDFRRGNQQVTQEWDAATGKYKDIAVGDAFKTTPDTVINNNLNQGEQATALLYPLANDAATRLEADDLDKELISAADAVLGRAPGGRYVQSSKYKEADQAKGQFLAAVLRKESQAQITPVEYQTYDPIFFPQPGDDDKIIANKRQLRRLWVESLKFSMGSKGEMLNQAPGGNGGYEIIGVEP